MYTKHKYILKIFLNIEVSKNYTNITKVSINGHKKNNNTKFCTIQNNNNTVEQNN